MFTISILQLFIPTPFTICSIMFISVSTSSSLLFGWMQGRHICGFIPSSYTLFFLWCSIQSSFIIHYYLLIGNHIYPTNLNQMSVTHSRWLYFHFSSFSTLHVSNLYTATHHTNDFRTHFLIANPVLLVTSWFFSQICFLCLCYLIFSSHLLWLFFFIILPN